MENTGDALGTSTYQGQRVETAKMSFRDRLATKEWILFLLFVTPNFLFLILFTYWPLWENFKLSFQNTDLLAFTGNNEFGGLDNYEYLFNNRTFQQVLKNTLIFIVACVGFTMFYRPHGGPAAQPEAAGTDGVRAVVFAPFLLSGAAIGIVWAYIFDPRFGLLAQMLELVQHSFATLAGPPRVGASRRDHRLCLEEPWICLGDFPGRPAGHSAGPLRRGQDRRRKRLVAIQVRHHSHALPHHRSSSSLPPSSPPSRHSTSSR